MARQTRTKHEILALMRRLGKHERIDRDGYLLTRLGMSIDSAVNELGGSPY